MASIDIMDVTPREIMGRLLAYAVYNFDEYRKHRCGDTAIFQTILNARIYVGKLVHEPATLSPREIMALTKVYDLARKTVPHPKTFPPMSVREFQANVFFNCVVKP